VAKDFASSTTIVLDLGFSKEGTTGIAVSDGRFGSVPFGDATRYVVNACADATEPMLLIVEAPLSTCLSEDGNPTHRFGAERGRGWWYGAGSIVALAAQALLDQVAVGAPPQKVIFLAEAFLSHKKLKQSEKTDVGLNAHEAIFILDKFWVQAASAQGPSALARIDPGLLARIDPVFPGARLTS
jgi:hypothetical protein